MSIQITINPSTMTADDRQKLAVILDLYFADKQTRPAPAVPTIAAVDNPATGVEVPTANEAFRAEPSPAAAFSTADNPAAAFATATDPNANPPGVVASTSSEPGPATGIDAVAPQAAATPAGTPANAATVDVDARGFPWNAQIHAESKAKIADGTWRKKRGVDAALVAQVEEQLRAVMAIPGPNAAAATGAASQVAQGPAAPIAAITAPVAPELGNVAPPPPPVSTAPSPVAPPTVAAAATPTNAVSVNPSGAFAGVTGFVDFIGKLGPYLQSQKLTQDEVKAACVAAGVPALEMLAPRPDLVPTVAATLDAILLTKA